MDDEVNTAKEKSHCRNDHGLPRPGWLEKPQPLSLIVRAEQPEQRNLLHRPQRATDDTSGTHAEVDVKGKSIRKRRDGGAPSSRRTAHCKV